MYDIFMKRPSDSSGVAIYQPANPNLRLISPKLTVELGKAGSLEFGVPSTNSYYDSNLEQLRTLVVVMQDGVELFRGRVLNRKKGFNNVVNVYCEGDLSYLVDSVQKAKKFDGKAIDLFKAIIAAHNSLMTTSADAFSAGKTFEIGVIDAVDASRTVLLVGKSDKEQEKYEDAERTKFNLKQIAIDSIAEEWQNTYDYIDSCLVKYCGGYLRTRRGTKNGKAVTYIDWLKKGSSQFGTTTQTIEFAKNILDLNEEFNPEEAFSVLIPIGESTSDDNSKYDPLTVKNADSKTVTANGHTIVHTKGSLEIVDQTLVNRFGRIVKTNVFDGVTNKDTLLTDGIRYIQDNADFPITIEVRAIDMHIVDASVQTISLGNKVTILSQGHNINRSDLVCTKIEYDLANPANTVYTFGNPKQELTRRYKKDKKKQADQAGRSGGGGGGAAKENAVTESEIKETLRYKAWATIDNDRGIVDIGTLYGMLYGEDVKEKITSTSFKMSSKPNAAAINLDAAFKNITKAGINITASENASSTEIFANNGAIGASITATATALENSIALKANKVDVDADILNLNTKVINLGKDIDEVELAAKNLKVKVDKLDIEGLVAITGSVSVVSGHLSGAIAAAAGSTYYIAGVQSGFSEHKHSLTCSSSGVVTSGTCTWGSDNSFNIADTKYFKDAVSAAKPASIFMSYTTEPYNNRERYVITMTAKNKKGEVLLSTTGRTDVTLYKHGADSVSVTNAYATGGGDGYARVQIELSNGKSVNKKVTW